MPNVQRQGDANSAGGIALNGDASVRVNGRPVMVNSRTVTPHPPGGRPGQNAHLTAKTAGGTSSVRVQGIPLVYTGCKDTCGHPRAGGSPDTRVL
jgi:uncharacterized Zn-binding protein involved in type VI secretion